MKNGDINLLLDGATAVVEKEIQNLLIDVAHQFKGGFIFFILP